LIRAAMRVPVTTAAKAAVLAAAALATALATALPAVAGDDLADVPEPQGLWTGPMYGATPRTLAGATVVDVPAVEALMADKPLLIDVGPADRKPETLPKGRPWLPVHRSIPGAVWMPGAGAAPLDAEREALFYRRVAELTRDDTTKPIVVFCRSGCWGSWNAAKRLVAKGYISVRWFPDGIDGWQDTHAIAEVKPDAGWSAGAGR
jgi:PQQ-dependent catabolism-associated CXXCW motif protein